MKQIQKERIEMLTMALGDRCLIRIEVSDINQLVRIAVDMGIDLPVYRSTWHTTEERAANSLIDQLKIAVRRDMERLNMRLLTLRAAYENP